MNADDTAVIADMGDDARDAKLYRELMADPVMQAIKQHLAAGLEYAARLEKAKKP